MKRNNFLFFGVLLIISSCASIESEVVTEGDKLNVVDENQIFIKYLEDEDNIGVFPEGYNRAVLATYYGTELQRLIYDQLLKISGIK